MKNRPVHNLVGRQVTKEIANGRLIELLVVLQTGNPAPDTLINQLTNKLFYQFLNHSRVMLMFQFMDTCCQ